MDEILLAQQRLGEAIERSQVHFGGLSELVRSLGLRFVQQFTGLLRLSRMHALDNDAFVRPVADFVVLSEELSRMLGAIHLVAIEDQVYVNDVRMRLPHDEGNLSEVLRRHNVGGVSFHMPLDQGATRSVIACFSASPARGYRRAGLRKALKKAGVEGVALSGIFLFRLGDEDEEAMRSTVLMMERAHRSVEEAWTAVGELRVPNPLPLRRSVTEMLSSGLVAEGLWDRLDEADPHSRHSVRVARYALVIGEAIGLNAANMQDLGVAAVFHDIGYVSREGAEPAKDGRRGHPGYPPPFERHGAAGTRMLLKQRGFHEARVHRMLTALEHHKDFADPSGKPSLFARIVRIAEDFDNFSSSLHSYFSPARALELMVGMAGSIYDPVLFQVFMNRVGKYPPGTLLKLKDGRIVCSRSLVRVPEAFDRPECFVVRQADGLRPKVSGLIDLAWDGVVESPVDPQFRPFESVPMGLIDEPTLTLTFRKTMAEVREYAPDATESPTGSLPVPQNIVVEQEEEEPKGGEESEWELIDDLVSDPEDGDDIANWDDESDWNS